MGDLKTCRHCSSKVNSRRMAKHVAMVHPDSEGNEGKSSTQIQVEFRRARELKEETRAEAKKRSERRGFAGKAVKASVAALAIVGLMAAVYVVVSTPRVTTGSPAPNFEVFDSDGYPFRVSDQKGKPVVIYFMRGTWCPSCKASMPALKQAFDNYKARGLVMLTIDLDRSESVSDLKAYMAAHGATWKFALDEAGVGSLYGATSDVGTKVYIDKKGNIAGRDAGIAEYDKMRSVLDGLVGA